MTQQWDELWILKICWTFSIIVTCVLLLISEDKNSLNINIILRKYFHTVLHTTKDVRKIMWIYILVFETEDTVELDTKGKTINVVQLLCQYLGIDIMSYCVIDQTFDLILLFFYLKKNKIVLLLSTMSNHNVRSCKYTII